MMINSDFKYKKNGYMHFCINRKNLDSKTIKSYSTDLKLFEKFVIQNNLKWQEKKSIEIFIESLHTDYKPKSVKRKIASLKAFFHYLEIEEIIEFNPLLYSELHP